MDHLEDTVLFIAMLLFLSVPLAALIVASLLKKRYG